MKGKVLNNELARLENVISLDRLSLNKNFNELLVKDLENLLKEYFDISSNIEVSLLKAENKYFVKIECNAVRVKPFFQMPR